MADLNKEQMRAKFIFAFCDDNLLYIYDDPQKACQQFEGIDVEDGFVWFYDGHGNRLKAIFDKPNKEFNFLWFFQIAQSGIYHLEPTPKGEHFHLVSEMLDLDHEVEPNPWFNTFAEVREFLNWKKPVPPSENNKMK